MSKINNLKILLNEYEQKRYKKIHDFENFKSELYKEIPRLKEIDKELSHMAIKNTKLLINNPDQSIITQMENIINNLIKEKKNLLNSVNISIESFGPKYDCNICHDTGYYSENNRTIMCNCLKQKLLDIEYNQANMSNLKKETFDNFNLAYYSDKPDKEKYNSDISPRDNILMIKNVAINFINNFDNPNEKNLLFSGNTGLGKTFLSSCIANEILKKGKTVLYQTAPMMLDNIIDFRFGKKTEVSNLYDTIINTDLLVIDDLGTEYMNNIKFTELFNIINTRILTSDKNTKTIISTNLNINNLLSTYDERIMSRLIGSYNICRFFGEDIRFKKI